MKPLAVIATGMITGVGMNAPSSCAAIRCAIDRFEETKFKDQEGEWIIGSAVPLNPPVRGREKLVQMAASVIAECLPALNGKSVEQVPLLLCVSEENRPGRFDELDGSLLSDIASKLGTNFGGSSAVIAGGRVGGVVAMDRARQLLADGHPSCLVVGVDTFLVGLTLTAYEAKQRLLTSKNSNGFIPGEGAGALLLGQPRSGDGQELRCLGIGFGHEQASIESEEPFKADGMAAAFRAAIADAECGFENVDYRLADCNGEQYAFKEASLALSRTMRVRKNEFDIWHAADCIGEVGAATVPCAVAIARAAAMKRYAPGAGVLAHFGNDSGERAALVLRFGE